MQDVQQTIIQQQEESSEQEQQRQIVLLMRRICFHDQDDAQVRKYQYFSESIQPFLYFYKLLALKPCQKLHKQKLKLNIPDTIVFNDKDNPLMWLYTNNQGDVCRIDNVAYYNITNKLTEGALEKELVAVLKKSSYGYSGPSGNDVKVIGASEIKTVLSSVLSSRSQISVIQRFVKSNSIKPSIMRTAWRRNGTHQGWILTSAYEYTSTAKVNEISKFIVNTKIPKAFTAVKCGSEKYMNQTLIYVNSIVQFLERYLKIQFKQLVCDFIKDEGGNWWYINTRAFILIKQCTKLDLKPITHHTDDESMNSERAKSLSTYTCCRRCKYCYNVISENLMTHRLTLMMILQCDQYLVKLGQNMPWLQRCFTQHLSASNLYMQHKVCDSCYEFYKQVQKLISLQFKMAQITGMKVSSDDRNIVSITSLPFFKGGSTQFGSRLQQINYQKNMPQGWGFPKNQEIRIQLHHHDHPEVCKFRFMIFIHAIRDIPNDSEIYKHTYEIGYEFLSQKIKYQLDLAKCQPLQNNFLKINIDCLKIYYFFAQNRQKVKKFIDDVLKISLFLYQDDQILGRIQLQLEDFKSQRVIKRDFFKMFSGKNIYPYLSWGLFVTLGLHQGSTLNSNIFNLINWNHLLLPETGYYNCEPLPEDWINMIAQKPDKIRINPPKFSQKQEQVNFKTEQNQFIRKEVNKYLYGKTDKHKKINLYY